jgi:hypothetical protein
VDAVDAPCRPHPHPQSNYSKSKQDTSADALANALIAHLASHQSHCCRPICTTKAGYATANQLSGTVATGQPNDCIASPAHDYICYFLERSCLELHEYAIKIPGNDDQQAGSDAWDGRIGHGVRKDAEKNS